MIPLSFFRHAKEAALLRRVTRTGTVKSVTDPPPGSLKEAIERARQHVAAARLQGSIRGAEARKVMGMTVFSGMLVATIVGVLVVPALFVFVERYIAKSETHPATDATPTEEISS